MKKLIIFAVAITFVMGAAMAAEHPIDQKHPIIFDQSTPDKATECDRMKASGATEEQLAGQGCCSWHGGVCGCAGTRAVCCDGSYSPSCGC